jgi:hypothetical protein
MPPAAQTHFMNPMKHLRATVAAHVAVHEGIATRAQKAHAARLAKLAKMKQDAALTQGVTIPSAKL